MKRFVAPLRLEKQRAEATQQRFETPPGHQAQIDRGTIKTRFRQQPTELRVFVLALHARILGLPEIDTPLLRCRIRLGATVDSKRSKRSGLTLTAPRRQMRAVPSRAP